MKYCSKCGKEIMDEAVICVHCGCSTTNQNAAKPSIDANDAPSTGLAVLGFFIPVVGLILYLTNKTTAPKKAKSSGKGALIGFCVSVALSIVYAILSIALASAMY